MTNDLTNRFFMILIDSVAVSRLLKNQVIRLTVIL